MNPEALDTYDLARRRAMIDADEAALDALLADDLTWTHSSGVTESKSEFIAAITTRRVVYEVLEVTEDIQRRYGDTFVHSGVLHGRASRDNQSKLLGARFLAVWREAGGRLKLHAW